MKAGVAETLRCFLREVAQSGFEERSIVCIGSKSLVVRDRFWFGVDEKFVGVDSVRFAKKSGAPASKRFFEAFERNLLQLANRFDAERLQSSFCNFADTGNSAHRERREKRRFASRRNPNEAAWFGLVARYFCNEPCGAEAA